jgi:hypothetical protein
MILTRCRLVTLPAVSVWALMLAISACSSDDNTNATSSSVTTPTSMSATSKTTSTPAVPTFGSRRDVATTTPSPQGERTSEIALSVQELAAGDLTGDGLEDLVVTHVRWSSVETYPISILVNDGRGNLRDATAELFEGSVPRTQQPRQTILADFNGDDRLDIFVADTGVDVAPYPGYLSQLSLSSPDGRYVDATANVAQRPGYAHSAAAGDIDGDGDVDLFLGQFAPRILVNDGTGRFSDASDRLPASIAAAELFARAEFVDVDGDGATDLVLLGHGSASAVLVNDGTGSFRERAEPLPTKPFGDDAIGTAIEPIDLNGDDDVDLLVGWTKGTPFYKGRWIQALVNDGNGTFRDETERRLPQMTNDDQWVYDLVAGDLNGDDFVDVGFDLGPTFADPAHSLPPVFFLNRGDGTFEPLPSDAFADPPFGQFRLVDIDDDGRTDVVSAWAAPSGVETFAVSSRTS